MIGARRALGAAAALALSCAGGTPPVVQEAAAPAPAAPVVAEAWQTERFPKDNIDSPAFWQSPGGDAWVLATAKSTDRILVFDASTGRRRAETGSPGNGPGQFRRPNGIAVAGDIALVVERDNARVQVLSLPGMRSLGVFGAGQLRKPYGIAVLTDASGGLDVWITDDYDVPASLAERVRQYRVSVVDGAVSAAPVRSFGDTSGSGALRTVETIVADPARDRLLIADEHASERNIKVYTRSGVFSGQVIGRGLFAAEPEGIALYACGDAGVWIATDQRADRTVFLVFDRETLAPAGAFRGAVTAGTDGVAASSSAFPGFGRGAFWAIDDDVLVAAFDGRAVWEALPAKTRSGCPWP